jgi:hypothetical protein
MLDGDVSEGDKIKITINSKDEIIVNIVSSSVEK